MIAIFISLAMNHAVLSNNWN